MVYRVSSTPACAALKIDKLTDQRRVIEKVCSPAIYEWEQGSINRRFRPGAGLILNSITPEALSWPLARRTDRRGFWPHRTP